MLFGKYAGTEIKIDGEDFLIMREEEVLGILEGAAKPKESPQRSSQRPVASGQSCWHGQPSLAQAMTTEV